MSEIRLQLCLRQKQKLEGFVVVVVKRLVGLLLFIVVLFCFLNKPKIFFPRFPIHRMLNVCRICCNFFNYMHSLQIWDCSPRNSQGIHGLPRNFGSWLWQSLARREADTCTPMPAKG